MKKKTLGAVLLSCCLSFTFFGCTLIDTIADGMQAGGAVSSPAIESEQAQADAPDSDTSVIASEQQSVYSAWVPYWDYVDALSEADEIGSNLDNAICFGAIFDVQDKIFLLSDTQEALTCMNLLYSKDRTIYLSIVNDIMLGESEFDNKSYDLLWRILGSDKAMETHIEDIMSILRKSGAEGLEIDYEVVYPDEALWQRIAVFIEQLYTQTTAEGYPLRVVLSWDSAKHATFPEGPQYTIMCYNLYGTHSGPGPKADRSFLQKVFSTNRTLPGNPAIAFATGGYDWCVDGSTASLTQSGAEDLQSANNIPSASVSRDSESAALNFTYFDESGLCHEVWYADDETLTYWRSLALDAGFTNFDLFRLGGNSAAVLSEFFDHSSQSSYNFGSS